MIDNCRGLANPDQIDNDKDEKGEWCCFLEGCFLLLVRSTCTAVDLVSVAQIDDTKTILV